MKDTICTEYNGWAASIEVPADVRDADMDEIAFWDHAGEMYDEWDLFYRHDIREG